MPADDDIFGEADDDMGDEVAAMTDDELIARARLLDNEIKVMRNESTRLGHEHAAHKERIKENNEKIKLNKQLPYLVANIVEILDMDAEEEPDEDGSSIDLDAHRKGKCVVIKTSTRQTIFLPVIGLVEASALKPADLVGVNKDSYLILDALPAEYDSRVKVRVPCRRFGLALRPARAVGRAACALPRCRLTRTHRAPAGDGGGREAHGAVQRHRRPREAGAGAGRGHRAPVHAQGALCEPGH